MWTMKYFSSFSNYSAYVSAESRMLCNCSFHISNAIYRSIFKAYRSLFMFERETFSFFSRDIAFIRTKYTRIFSYFSWVYSLSVSLASNDIFCHSKGFSISLPGFKEIDLKGLEQVKKCGLNSNLGFNSKDHPGLNHSQRVPGAASQTPDEAKPHGDNVWVLQVNICSQLKHLAFFSILPIHSLSRQSKGPSTPKIITINITINMLF